MDRTQKILIAIITVAWLGACSIIMAGPYSNGTGVDLTKIDSGIPGYVGPDGDGVISPQNTRNPRFITWASAVVNYAPSGDVDAAWTDPTQALGPVTGDHFDIVSLGDLTTGGLANGDAPGSITLQFDADIADGPGPDFAVFENGFELGTNELFAELAYVEVSTDGQTFIRFPSVSLTTNLIPFSLGTLDPSDVYNLAGKHANNDFRLSWGTPFDLGILALQSEVLNHTVDLQRIRYVRLIDIPGTGDFLDTDSRPIYDLWLSQGSAGFDLEAIGVINVRHDLNLGSNDLDFIAYPNRVYQLETTTTLSPPNWTPDGPLIIGDDQRHRIPLPFNTGSAGYFRLKVTP